MAHLLQGGDRRSIGRSDQVVAQVLRKPSLFRGLIECLWSDDLIIRMRAADAAEKASAKKPELLAPFKSALLGLASETTQAELRWHLAQMLPRLALTEAEHERAIATLRGYLADSSSIARTFALQALADLAQGHPSLKTEIAALIEHSCRVGTPAMKARSRKLLKRAEKS